MNEETFKYIRSRIKQGVSPMAIVIELELKGKVVTQDEIEVAEESKSLEEFITKMQTI